MELAYCLGNIVAATAPIVSQMALPIPYLVLVFFTMSGFIFSTCLDRFNVNTKKTQKNTHNVEKSII